MIGHSYLQRINYAAAMPPTAFCQKIPFADGIGDFFILSLLRFS